MISNKAYLGKTLSIILGDKKHSPSECLTFTAHEERFRPTLDLILEKANQKKAVLHSKMNVSTDPFDETNILSAWQEGRRLVHFGQSIFFKYTGNTDGSPIRIY